jgi:nucleoside-diphosphate-sugar epimerase
MAALKFTVFGGRGFVGGQLADHLRSRGHEVLVPSRGAEETRGCELGHVVYTIGLTGDFRSRPFDTIEAHVTVLARLLRECRFDSWLYLASTRVYGGLGAQQIACEDAQIPLRPSADSLYDLSKLLGEALCLAQPLPTVRVARLSNVYGPGQSRHTFLASILEELGRGAGTVLVREAPESAKDYVAISDILPVLEAIALHGKERLYNVASGQKVRHAELAERIRALTGARLEFFKDAPLRDFPLIDVSRVAAEFGYAPVRLTDNLSDLLAASRSRQTSGVGL